jgi:membrane fusion protein, multidrug efflux system
LGFWLGSYEVIRAGSDGIITAGYVDPGALIPQVTTPGDSTPTVDLAALGPLRVYADVPQDIAVFVRNDDSAIVTVTQFPGRKFVGQVTRHPQALASDTRTMRVEVDLPNLDPALYPGMYATIVLNVSSAEDTVSVPDDALVFRHGDVYVPVVRNNRIHLAIVALGNDDGREVEIESGVSEGDLIAVNVGEGVEDRDPVQPVVLAGVH